jgi:hypothetical protein
VVRKSCVLNPNVNDLGGYMLVDANANFVVAGSDFDLSLDEVEAYLAGDESV